MRPRHRAGYRVSHTENRKALFYRDLQTTKGPAEKSAGPFFMRKSSKIFGLAPYHRGSFIVLVASIQLVVKFADCFLRLDNGIASASLASLAYALRCRVRDQKRLRQGVILLFARG